MTSREHQETTALLPAYTDEANGGLFGPGARRTDNSRTMTVILILNYMIGSGILNTAQTFRNSGAAASCVLFIVSGVLVWLGSVLMIRAAEVSAPKDPKDVLGANGGALEDLEYSALASRTLGPRGGVLVDGSIIVMNFGAICSYIVLVGGLTVSVLEEWLGDGPGGAIVPVWRCFFVVAPVMVLLFVLPPSLIRHLSNLRWLAAFSLLAITAVVSLVVLGGPIYGARERAQPFHDPGLDAPIILLDWVGSFAKLGSAVFAVTCAPAALHSYSGMEKRNPREWEAVMTWAAGLGGALCFATGLMGYLSFHDATSGDILDNYTGNIASWFKILVVAHLIMYIPHETVVLRHSLFAIHSRDVMDEGFLAVAAVTFGFLGFSLFLVLVLMSAGLTEGDLFGYILDVTGGATGSLLSFVLPAVTYLKATEGNEEWKGVGAYRAAAKFLAVFGLALMFLVPGAVFVTVLTR